LRAGERFASSFANVMPTPTWLPRTEGKGMCCAPLKAPGCERPERNPLQIDDPVPSFA
jgi:hypothetical protein